MSFPLLPKQFSYFTLQRSSMASSISLSYLPFSRRLIFTSTTTEPIPLTIATFKYCRSSYLPIPLLIATFHYCRGVICHFHCSISSLLNFVPPFPFPTAALSSLLNFVPSFPVPLQHSPLSNCGPLHRHRLPQTNSCIPYRPVRPL